MNKGRFLDPLVLQAYAKGEWALSTDFRYQSIDGTIYKAPKFFITDLASTPWAVKPLLRGIEDRECGVIHDYLYCANELPREVCDALFFEMLLAAGADLRRSRLMHFGLKIGGGPRYVACQGGMRVEDLAFELMTAEERKGWLTRIKMLHGISNSSI